MRPQRGLIELLALATAAYVPHLIEEALTGMHDDPLVVAALAGLAQLSTRHAAYLVFQAMFVLVLASTLAFALGGARASASCRCWASPSSQRDTTPSAPASRSTTTPAS